MILNVSKYVKERIASRIDDFIIEGIYFELKPLTEEMANEIANEDSYNDALILAVKMGVCVGGERAYKDERSLAALNSMWLQPEMEAANEDSDPCIQYRVGERICEITNMPELTEVIEELRKQFVIEGDDLPKNVDTVTVEDLNSHANDALTAIG